jgi:mannose-6-phosphate isomerase
VIKTKTQAGKVVPRQMDGFIRLIEQRYFVVDRFEIGDAGETPVAFSGPGCLVALSGSAAVITEHDRVELKVGEAVVVPPGKGATVETGSGVSFVRCVAPA